MKDRIIFCAIMAAAGFLASALAPVLLGHSFSFRGSLLAAIALAIFGLAVIVIAGVKP